MSYSVLQTSLDPPPRDALRRAFDRVSFLTDHDAAILAKDAHGVLLGRVSHDDAIAVHKALAQTGIEAAIVPGADLFSVPTPKSTRRVACSATSLTWYDTYDRPHAIDWPHVVVVAAGMIGAVNRHEDVMLVTRPSHGHPMTITTTRESTRCDLSLEIYTDQDPMRIRVEPGRCNYAYLGPRLQTRAQDNFLLLVKDIVRFAGAALVNRGARSICATSDRVYVYSAQRAFNEETAWWVWRGLNPPARDGASAKSH